MNKTMSTRFHGLRALTLFFMLLGLMATTALAQESDGQDHKRAFNAALETAKEGQQAQKGGDLATAEQKYAEAYEAFAETAGEAEASEDAQVARKANHIAAQLAYKAGLIATNQENYEEALGHFQNGASYAPTYAKTYLGRASALKKLDRMEDAMAAYAEAVEVGRANGDYETAQKAEQAIRDNYIYLASSTLSGENVSASAADEAIGYIEQMQEYVEADADAYFYLAAAHNTKGNYARAIELADTALEMHTGSKSDAAKIYFIRGEALMKQGNNRDAIASFENASYGEYEASAQHYIDQLSGGTR